MTGDTTSRRGLLAGLAVGVPLIAYGVRGAMVDASDTHPAEMARWLVGVTLVDDLVAVPVALLAGVVGRRATPSWAWPAVRAGLFVTAVLVLVGWPFVRGWGRDPTDPSLLARDYGAGLAVALGVVWTTVAVVAAWARRRDRRARPTGRTS